MKGNFVFENKEKKLFTTKMKGKFSKLARGLKASGVIS